MKKISAGSWAFAFRSYSSDPIPFEKCAKRLAEAGYDAIEVCGLKEHITLDAYPTKESRLEVKQMLEDLGLETSGYQCDQRSADPTEEGNREKYLNLFARNLEMSNDLGIRDIRVDTVAPPDKYTEDGDYESAKGHLAETFRTAAEKAKDAGVKAHWEFEPGFIFNKPSEVVEIHDKVDHPNFRIMFDTGHAYMCAVVGTRQHGEKQTLAGGVEELLSKLEGKVGAIHVNDSDGTLHENRTSTHSPLGTGYVNFREITPKLLALPGIDYWTIDMVFPGAWELAEASLAYVKKLLKEAEPKPEEI